MMNFHKLQCLALLLIFQSIGFGQLSDKVTVFADLTLGFSPIKLAGTFDSGLGTVTIIDAHAVPEAPELVHGEDRTLLITPKLHIGLDIPFYSSEHNSFGLKVAVGGGRQFEVPGDPNFLTAYVYDFPQYFYYRNNKHSIDYSIQIGYKYSHTILPSHHILAAFELNLSEASSIKLYSSLFSYKYYTYYTNGRFEPQVTIPEFGLTYGLNF
jgi:hypothetical protein